MLLCGPRSNIVCFVNGTINCFCKQVLPYNVHMLCISSKLEKAYTARVLYWSNMATLLQNNMDTQFNKQKEDSRLYPGRTTPEVETASFSCMLVYHNKKRTQDARECHVCKPTITCSNVIVSANTPQDKIKWEENHATYMCAA